MLKSNFHGSGGNYANARGARHVAHLTCYERTLMFVLVWCRVRAVRADLAGAIDGELRAFASESGSNCPLALNTRTLYSCFLPGASTTSNGTTCTWATFWSPGVSLGHAGSGPASGFWSAVAQAIHIIHRGHINAAVRNDRRRIDRFAREPQLRQRS